MRLTKALELCSLQTCTTKVVGRGLKKSLARLRLSISLGAQNSRFLVAQAFFFLLFLSIFYSDISRLEKSIELY